MGKFSDIVSSWHEQSFSIDEIGFFWVVFLPETSEHTPEDICEKCDLKNFYYILKGYQEPTSDPLDKIAGVLRNEVEAKNFAKALLQKKAEEV